MSVALAAIVLRAAALYLGAGFVFALAFASFGITRVDAASRGAPIGFRLVILPGVALLWPLLAWRWVRAGRGPPIECSPHLVASHTDGGPR